MKAPLDTVVVGAGQAGLVASRFLSDAGVEHVVLERGRIGESWRSQRWDSFFLNTPNWSNGLAGSPFHPEAPHAFEHRDALVAYFERYARQFRLPVREQVPVTALERHPAGGFTIHVDGERLWTSAVIVASGSMSRPRVPPMARRLPDGMPSLSAGTYKSPAALPDGAVVVVGSGQSGCQIAEDLLGAGRRVYVSASRVGRVPRFYRGRDILAWWRDMRFLEVTADELEDPAIQFAAQPQVSGTAGGHTVSLQSLARDGATLLGRAVDIAGSTLKLGDGLNDCIAFADDKAEQFKAAIDQYIAEHAIEASPPTPDPGEPSLPDLGGSDRLDALDLRSAGIGTVIWCTGFDADWSWVRVDVFDEHGRPRHRAGISECRGLYFLGMPWLAKRKSGILYGVSEDAARIVQHIERHVLRRQAD